MAHQIALLVSLLPLVDGFAVPSPLGLAPTLGATCRHWRAARWKPGFGAGAGGVRSHLLAGGNQFAGSRGVVALRASDDYDDDAFYGELGGGGDGGAKGGGGAPPVKKGPYLKRAVNDYRKKKKTPVTPPPAPKKEPAEKKKRAMRGTAGNPRDVAFAVSDPHQNVQPNLTGMSPQGYHVSMQQCEPDLDTFCRCCPREKRVKAMIL